MFYCFYNALVIRNELTEEILIAMRRLIQIQSKAISPVFVKLVKRNAGRF